MKRSILFVMLAICLCGCDSGNSEAKSETQNIITLEDLQKPITEAGKTKEQIPVNTTQETIAMEWDGVRIQSRIFAATGNKLYFCQWAREGRESALYEGEIGGSTLRKVDMELSEGINIYDMTSDESGHLYLLLRDKQANSGNVTSIVREVDEDGKLVEDFDISEAIQNKMSLHQAFLVDGEGNFYIRGMSSAMYISREGKPLWEVKDNEIGIEHSFGAACGADGAIYLTYRKGDSSYIGKLNSKDGSISEEYHLTEIKVQEQVLALGRGTDCDFLLYGNQSGCWAWNQADNSMEARTELSEGDLPYNECIIVRGFLEDGRLLLVKNVSEGDELVGRKLEYYPAGR